MALRVDIVRSVEGLAQLRGEWNQLLERSGSNHVFLTWEWVSTWWSVYGGRGELHILTARDPDGALVGIGPLRRHSRFFPGPRNLNVLALIGSGGDVHPEYLDLIVQAGREREAVAAFVECIADDEEEIDGVDFRPLSESSPNIVSLVEQLAGRFRYLWQQDDSVCPYVSLPATADAFNSSRSQNYRKKLREYESRCKRRLSPQLRLSDTAEEVQRDLQTLIDLHHRRWRGASRAFQTSAYIDFHHRVSQLGLEKGWVRLFSLETAGRPMAMLYCFAYGGRYYYYQAGRDPEFAQDRVGLILMHRAIQHALSERAQIFDFLRGQEEYKYRWASGDTRNFRLVAWRSHTARTKAAVVQGLARMRGLAQWLEFPL
jgi:CelD/BcsL family acetyltransferase involved in cellulose biosynthesis